MVKEEFNKIATEFIQKNEQNVTNKTESKDQQKEKLIQKNTKYNLTSDKVKQLEEWSGLKCGNILFDSDVDNWKQNSSVFNERIIGKKQLTFLIEDEDKEKFGYYLNTQVVGKYCEDIPTDVKSFEFNIESNGRLKTPLKLEMLKSFWGGYQLWEKSKERLISLGDIQIYKENKKNTSYCIQNNTFNYHDIDKALCGKIGSLNGGEKIKVKRIIVIQMV